MGCASNLALTAEHLASVCSHPPFPTSSRAQLPQKICFHTFCLRKHYFIPFFLVKWGFFSLLQGLSVAIPHALLNLKNFIIIDAQIQWPKCGYPVYPIQCILTDIIIIWFNHLDKNHFHQISIILVAQICLHRCSKFINPQKESLYFYRMYFLL